VNSLKKTLTTAQLAARWGVKQSKVIALIRSGELEGFNVALKPDGRPRFRVSPEAVQKFEERRAVQPAPKQPRRYRKPKDKGFIEYI
jgi:hypothetical protein